MKTIGLALLTIMVAISLLAGVNWAIERIAWRLGAGFSSPR